MTGFTQALDALAERDDHAAIWPGFSVVRAEASPATTPAMLGPSLCLLTRGRKRVHLGERFVEYAPGSWLLVTLPVPTRTDVEVVGDAALRGMSLTLDRGVLAEVAAAVPPDSWPTVNLTQREADARASQPLHVADLDPALEASLTRFLTALADPLERSVLAAALLREVYLRLLLSANGPVLRDIVSNEPGRFRIQATMRWIEENYTRDLPIDQVARHAGMSPATLHRHFRAATGTSPTQYLKAIRLHQARSRLLTGAPVTATAHEVGYSSAAQFSREYRRLFGHSPRQTRPG